eukprot:gnl/TRDRNA2_/TRDRNA2_133190_c0_seq1.p1 gnl/TRDRNA2_/TRDRNA2_133190_c0~~gnl/TRDRNA2_/TRDRNA2_133190_c0_seq1.p1  ORF type:complete len:604 (+),score=86.03 gnl/TRDRNA2_/TRDRNA2_133190_c0_seq1:59-1870(+)
MDPLLLQSIKTDLLGKYDELHVVKEKLGQKMRTARLHIIKASPTTGCQVAMPVVCATTPPSDGSSAAATTCTDPRSQSLSSAATVLGPDPLPCVVNGRPAVGRALEAACESEASPDSDTARCYGASAAPTALEPHVSSQCTQFLIAKIGERDRQIEKLQVEASRVRSELQRGREVVGQLQSQLRVCQEGIGANLSVFGGIPETHCEAASDDMLATTQPVPRICAEVVSRARPMDALDAAEASSSAASIAHAPEEQQQHRREWRLDGVSNVVVPRQGSGALPTKYVKSSPSLHSAPSPSLSGGGAGSSVTCTPASYPGSFRKAPESCSSTPREPTSATSHATPLESALDAAKPPSLPTTVAKPIEAWATYPSWEQERYKLAPTATTTISTSASSKWPASVKQIAHLSALPQADALQGHVVEMRRAKSEKLLGGGSLDGPAAALARDTAAAVKAFGVLAHGGGLLPEADNCKARAGRSWSPPTRCPMQPATSASSAYSSPRRMVMGHQVSYGVLTHAMVNHQDGSALSAGSSPRRNASARSSPCRAILRTGPGGWVNVQPVRRHGVFSHEVAAVVGHLAMDNREMKHAIPAAVHSNLTVETSQTG